MYPSISHQQRVIKRYNKLDVSEQGDRLLFPSTVMLKWYRQRQTLCCLKGYGMVLSGKTPAYGGKTGGMGSRKGRTSTDCYNEKFATKVQSGGINSKADLACILDPKFPI